MTKPIRRDEWQKLTTQEILLSIGFAMDVVKERNLSGPELDDLFQMVIFEAICKFKNGALALIP
jgi:hypothetical protein